ncbi:MAG: hypothetical protein O7A64_05310, partial [Alphaproteobacteria bacterium]|nr:hypothetical protein [Alphaproteobacteria bacterium]
AESAGANDYHVYIMMLSARDDSACDGAFFHFAHDVVNALLLGSSLRIDHQMAGDFLQDLDVRPHDVFQCGIFPQAFRKLLALQPR